MQDLKLRPRQRHRLPLPAHRERGPIDQQLTDAQRGLLLGATARRLATRRWDGVFTSPLSRARETAEIIAAELGIEIDRISVKATTTEKLGYIGRREGLAAEAVVLLDRILR